MSAGILYLDGLAFWSPTLSDWTMARAAFRGEGGLLDPPMRRPSPELLAPTERRRAPDTVAIALEVASRAVAEAGQNPIELASIFTSAHGDLAINDYMCATLVNEPLAISPTKFHNSVHNAAAGYWTIGTGCMQASTALTAFTHSFAHGLLEAISQASSDRKPVLLVAYDIAACGALASVTESRGMLATALVLNPLPTSRSIGALRWSLPRGALAASPLSSAAARSLQANAMADCLPLLERFAMGEGETDVTLGDTLTLRTHWTPQHADR
jgi:Beta-ketoacyl synthase, N-terminal domain